MTIPLNNYVNIQSGLGAGAVATTRTLVGRLFTGSTLVPQGQFLSFSSATDVGNYFGTTSEEYYRSQFYFSWVNKDQNQPQSIQFARWVNVDTNAKVYSSHQIGIFNAALWTPISNGGFVININGVSLDLSGTLIFTGVVNGADVAAALQTGIRTGTGTAFTAATVTYSAVAPGMGFTITAGGTAGAQTISISAATSGTDITGLVYTGWLPQQVIAQNGTFTAGSIFSPGAVAEDIAVMLTNSGNLSNNFGSFLFLNNLNLTINQINEAATWNQGENVLYMYTVGVTPANAAAWSALAYPGVGAVGGVALTLSPALSPAQYPEQAPMMIEAATDYTAQNSVQNYMYQTFAGLTPSVNSQTDYDLYNSMNINFYGATQTAGNIISFYQPGFLQGSSVSTNIPDMTDYVNEIWLKDANAVAIINLLIGLNQVAANAQGRAQVLSVIQDVIQQALNNGVISVGKTLTAAQQSFITNESGLNTAWYQVQNSGYWVDCVIKPTPSITPTQYEADYTLIYSKNDVVRIVNGVQTLI